MSQLELLPREILLMIARSLPASSMFSLADSSPALKWIRPQLFSISLSRSDFSYHEHGLLQVYLPPVTYLPSPILEVHLYYTCFSTPKDVWFRLSPPPFADSNVVTDRNLSGQCVVRLKEDEMEKKGVREYRILYLWPVAPGRMSYRNLKELRLEILTEKRRHQKFRVNPLHILPEGVYRKEKRKAWLNISRLYNRRN